jgi:hypothetical protein
MALLGSGMTGGAMNVAVNLDSLKDADVRKSLAEQVLSQMRRIHDDASAGHAGPITDLWMGLARHAGLPAAPSREQQSARFAAETLRQLGSPEARQALELLAQAADEHVARCAREALSRFDT